jgi:hypothetical protein
LRALFIGKRGGMKKKNCWEFKNCGKNEDGSSNCPVPRMSMYEGVNGGKNGGRVCWIIADSACDCDVQSTFHHKLKTCSACDFYKAVKEEEEGKPSIPLDVLRKICGSDEEPDS